MKRISARRMLIAAGLAGALSFAAAGSALARDFFVAPVEPLTGTRLTDEARAVLAGVVKEDEFPTVEAALASGRLRAGDRLIMEPGHHGVLAISGRTPDGGIRIEGAGGLVHAEALNIANMANVTVAGITVFPRNGAVQGALVMITGDIRNLVVEDLDIRSTEDAAGYADWSVADWQRHQVDGVLLRSGTNVTLSRNRITGVYHGINSYALNARIVGNLIRGHSADGMRLLGDNTEASGNIIEDCVVIDGNHPDQIQMWSADDSGKPGFGVLRNLIISGNELYEWRSLKRSRIECASQGIVMFDGRIDGFRVTNNLVAVNAYHGITLAGVTNGVIANNTVVNTQGMRRGHPWIMVGPGKKGEQSADVVIANNLAGRIDGNGVRVVAVRNAAYGGPREFVAVQTQDFRPAGSGITMLADDADRTHAPPVDLRGVPRDGDKGPDIGAFELTPAER